MSEAFFVLAEDRIAIAIEGVDSLSFLQSLLSNDVQRVSTTQALWTGFLTPQGKYLHDFFLTQRYEIENKIETGLIADCDLERHQDLLQRLKRYRLRAAVTFKDLSATHTIGMVYGADSALHLGLKDQASHAGAVCAFSGGIAFVDPRLPAIGCRVILPYGRIEAKAILQDTGLLLGSHNAWESHRLKLGLPGTSDLEIEKATLLESGFEELNGIDWNKGCYVGQEVTARMKYRGLVRKRLLPVTYKGIQPALGAPILLAGHMVGEMRSSDSEGHGLALLRLEQAAKAVLEDQPLLAGESRLYPYKPDWASFDFI